MPKEWATFTRECQNRKKFPVALSDHLQRDKLDLFQAWLDNSKNLNEFPGYVSQRYIFRPKKV